MTAAATYPHTIDNGGGERLTFVARRTDDRGEYLEVRSTVAPGAGPPMHVHHQQEEAMTVERGTIAYQVLGEEERRAGPGETVVFAAGVAHRFWNPGEEEAVGSGWIRPVGNIEYFLCEIFASMQRSGSNRPGVFDAAYLTRRYRNEFALCDIPQPVQRFVFPVIVAAGRLFGRHRRFAGAPEPLAPAARRS